MNYKVKQMPIEARIELDGEDVSKRAAAIARALDRMDNGVITIRVEKYDQKWSISFERTMQVLVMDLTQ